MTRASFVSFPHFVKLSEFYQRSQPPRICVACWRCLLGPRPVLWGFQIHTDYRFTVDACDGSHGSRLPSSITWCVRTPRTPEGEAVVRLSESAALPFGKAPRPHLAPVIWYTEPSHGPRKIAPTGGGMAPPLGNTGLGATLSSPRPSMKQRCLQSPMHAFSKSWSPSSPSMWPSPVGRCYSSSIGAASVPV